MKKLICILTTLVIMISLSSCSKDNRTDFQKLVASIYDSEESLLSYEDTQVIKDNDTLVYSNYTKLTIKRLEEQINTNCTQEIKELSSKGEGLVTTTSSYTTKGDKKYQTINGKDYVTDYVVPTYFLTFVMSEEFLNDDYVLTVDKDDYELEATVKNEHISSMFLNKSLSTINDLSINISVVDNKLRSFNAEYTNASGFDVSINTTYKYPLVSSNKNAKAKAIFVLEGGSCRGYSNDVTYLYSLNEEGEALIYDPNSLEENPEYQIILHDYHIEGWYKTKNEDGTYSDKWDFKTDKMTSSGVTLYAKWAENLIFSYEVYKSVDDTEPVATLVVNKGDKFNDITLDLDIDGYTNIQYLDKDGNPWDTNFTHPGGDVDTAIRVNMQLIEGDFKVVRTAKELKNSKTKNIYLAADIDLKGADFNFNEYKGILLGNGYKISNFTVPSPSAKADITSDLNTKNSLYSSIFYKLDGATIKDVTFENVTYEIQNPLQTIRNVVICPLSTIVNNSTIENVKVVGTYEIKKVPTSATVTIITDSMFYNKDKEYQADDKANIMITVNDSREN